MRSSQLSSRIKGLARYASLRVVSALEFTLHIMQLMRLRQIKTVKWTN